MSIQAKELRVGNKLFTNLKNIHTVCQIHFEHNNIVDEECWIIGDNNHEISLLDLHPIPLSTDILLKCGVERLKGTDFYSKVFSVGNEKIEISINPENGVVYYDSNTVQLKLPVCYLHLHTFQNLIHSLTGSELEVKW